MCGVDAPRILYDEILRTMRKVDHTSESSRKHNMSLWNGANAFFYTISIPINIVLSVTFIIVVFDLFFSHSSVLCKVWMFYKYLIHFKFKIRDFKYSIVLKCISYNLLISFYKPDAIGRSFNIIEQKKTRAPFKRHKLYVRDDIRFLQYHQHLITYLARWIIVNYLYIIFGTRNFISVLLNESFSVKCKNKEMLFLPVMFVCFYFDVIRGNTEYFALNIFNDFFYTFRFW